jgi:hypothetical protein
LDKRKKSLKINAEGAYNINYKAYLVASKPNDTFNWYLKNYLVPVPLKAFNLYKS